LGQVIFLLYKEHQTFGDRLGKPKSLRGDGVLAMLLYRPTGHEENPWQTPITPSPTPAGGSRLYYSLARGVSGRFPPQERGGGKTRCNSLIACKRGKSRHSSAIASDKGSRGREKKRHQLHRPTNPNIERISRQSAPAKSGLDDEVGEGGCELQIAVSRITRCMHARTKGNPFVTCD
jgi:hypothetical protein